MNRPVLRTILNLAAIFGGLGLMAQDPVDQKLYHQQIEQGRQYKFSYADIKGHQFNESPVYQIGSLIFDGVGYQEILLNYDIYNDQVVTTMLQNGITQNIIVDKSRIEQFRIGPESFVNVTDSAKSVPPGIYQLLFEKNHVQLLAKVEKYVVGNNRPGELLKKFNTRHAYILSVGSESFSIASKKDLLLAFGENPEMRSTIQQAKIKFRKKTPDEDALLRVLDDLPL